MEFGTIFYIAYALIIIVIVILFVICLFYADKKNKKTL